MKLKNEVYDVLKWILITVIPALIFLITTLSTIYHFEELSNIICLTISAIATFTARILEISTKNYYAETQTKKGK